ncbi:hypothetical protein [Azospirillum argentinense]
MDLGAADRGGSRPLERSATGQGGGLDRGLDTTITLRCGGPGWTPARLWKSDRVWTSALRIGVEADPWNGAPPARVAG